MANSFNDGSFNANLANDSISHSSTVPYQLLHRSTTQRKVHSLSSISKFLLEDKENSDHTEGKDSNITEVTSASLESLEENLDNVESLENIDSDPDLRLLEIEPERWFNTASKEFVDSLTQRQIKKQEHIYELIITEKNHCLLLKAMKELFAKGMVTQLGMKESQVKTIFPALDDLITIHSTFLWNLRECQRNNRYIPSIGELLCQQFTGYSSKGLKYSYGIFCASHEEAVSYYKELLRTDKRFQAFIRATAGHRLMKKKGIPEGILFIAHRVTKYPLMLEALIKYSNDQPEEVDMLKKALLNVKDILVSINSQVAERQKRRRLVEIYDKIDPRSPVIFGTHKFKKSHLLSGGRKLMFEGQAACSLQPGKYQPIIVVVVSDLIFFLQEHSQKFHFLSPDGKAGVFALEKVTIKEKEDCDTKRLCVSTDTITELLEFECIHPKDTRIWIAAFREAIISCKDDGKLNYGKAKNQDIDVEKVRYIINEVHGHFTDLTAVCQHLEQSVNELATTLDYEEFASMPKLTPNEDLIKIDDFSIKSVETTLRLANNTCSWGRGLSSSVRSIAETIESNLYHRNRLEILRRNQNRLGNERLAFSKEREDLDKKMAEEREDIRKQQEALKARQDDINQQRDDLYRKLEALRQQGIVLSPSLTILSSAPIQPSGVTVQRASTFASTVPRVSVGSLSTFYPESAATVEKVKSEIKHRHSSANLAMFSRDSRSGANAPSADRRKSGNTVKQQLPMKLASLSSSGT